MRITDEELVSQGLIYPYSTLHGYNIEHLDLIARVLQKENLPPERVSEALMDIGRIAAIVCDEFTESLRKVAMDALGDVHPLDYNALTYLGKIKALPSVQPDHIAEVAKMVTQTDSYTADGCTGCAFVDIEEWNMPCRQCKRNCKDYWRAKPKENRND